MKYGILATILAILVTTPSVLALGQLELGDKCLIDAQCYSGWCNKICILNPCTDDVCELTVDCIFCPAKGYATGDCIPTDCGFNTAVCSDEVCSPEFDCYCAEPEFGDCGYYRCIYETNSEVATLLIIISILFVATIVVLYYKNKSKK